MKKVKRNDPCPCGSGKKFKKCCEQKMIGKRFIAKKIDTDLSKEAKKTNSLSSFFKNAVKKPENKKESPPEDKNS